MELQFEHPCHLISLCGVPRGFMDFRMGFCSALTQDSVCILAALGEPPVIPICSSSWKGNVFSTWSTMTCYGFFVSQYSCWSPFFSYQRQLEYLEGKCDFFFSFPQLCFMTLFPMTDFLNSKLLAHDIMVFYHSFFFCLIPSFFGVWVFFCAGSPFPACVIAGPSEKCHEEETT